MLMPTLFSQSIAFMESLKLLETTKKAQMFKTLQYYGPQTIPSCPKKLQDGGNMASSWSQQGLHSQPIFEGISAPCGTSKLPQDSLKMASRWSKTGPKMAILACLEARFGPSCHRLSPCLPMLGHVGHMLACVEAMLADVGAYFVAMLAHVGPIWG